MEFNFNISGFNIESFDIEKWLHETNFTTDGYLKRPNQQEKILKIALYVIAILVAIIGNLTLLVVIVSTKSLRTKFNFYILNLAFADLLVPLTCMWLHLVYDLNPTSWPLGSFFCRINPFMQVIVVCVGIFTLTVTVVDRFCSLVYPSLLNVTQKWQIPIIVFIWIAAIVLALPWIVYTKMSTYDWIGGPQTICQAHFPSEESRKIYTTIFVCLGYFIPLIVMFSLVVLTYKKAQPEREPVTEASKMYSESKRKAVHMVFTVLIVFFICWTPQQFLKLWDEYRPRTINSKLPNGIKTFAYISLYIGYLNSCINPFICMAYNKCLRHAALELILCKRRRVSSNSVAPENTGELNQVTIEQGTSSSDNQAHDQEQDTSSNDMTTVSTSS